MAKRASLAELMGAQAANKTELRLSHLPEILGEAMPELPRTPVGRHRLIRALQQRFGANFRSLPGLKDLIKEFDDDLEFEKKIAKMQAIKYQPTKRGG
jgi:hypothetical protein